MQSASGQIRAVEIVFPGQITDEETEQIRAQMMLMDAVVDMDLSNQYLKIRYNFPAVRFNLVWQIVVDTILSIPFSLAAKLKYSLFAYMEDNEYDHLQYPCGWDNYTRDVFVNYYFTRQFDRHGRKKLLWQQYSRNDNHKSNQ